MGQNQDAALIDSMGFVGPTCGNGDRACAGFVEMRAGFIRSRMKGNNCTVMQGKGHNSKPYLRSCFTR